MYVRSTGTSASRPLLRAGTISGVCALLGSICGVLLFASGNAVAQDAATDKSAAAEAVPAAVMRRLTGEQYRNVIADTFGPSIKVGGGFEPDPRVDGLSALGSSRVSVTPAGLAAYDNSALLVAAQLVSEKNRALLPCKPRNPKGPDNACATKFFTKVGERLYRRPLTQDELATSVKVAEEGARTLQDFYSGLGSSLSAMLSSVPFLFRIEQMEQAPDGGYRLDAYSLASRLSFFLWNTGPDDLLLAAAKNGDLKTEKGLIEHVERMLQSRRLESGVRAYFEDMLGFEAFGRLEKDPAIYPKYTSSVANDAREQTLRTITNKLLTEQGDYRDLFTDGKTVLTPLLASIYRVPISPGGVIGLPAPWMPYEFPKGDARAGILAHVSFLALHSHPGRSSPTLRGKGLREVFLCQKVPDPPANIDFTEFNDPNQPAKTTRDRLLAHSGSPACAGCHKLTDPMGLVMENFDSIGGFRVTEDGHPIDTSGGQLSNAKFDNVAGLGQAVSRDSATTACLVRRLTTYAVGSSASAQTGPWLKSLGEKFAQDGYRLPDLMRSIATSPQFSRTATPSIDPSTLSDASAGAVGKKAAR